MSYMDRDWADDHGYQHITCSRCGWSGWSDGPSCEGACADREESHGKACGECGEYGDNCQCERCAECGETRDDCECEFFAVETLRRFKTHTARRDHKDGKVKADDRYVETVLGGYYEGGPRWMTRSKRVTGFAGCARGARCGS